ncbi:hypothetical protein [Komagataeibacter diospyri]|uniref:Uncharacterized protein n=1 Tax=Komagataeibacter diospyri TaxID=1932662 RepID=A0A4V0WMW7_9PROT|nr:hypothetical protein [Komagataeibacter diospyri]GCE85112.1 hypothetical protein MSKU9_3253 [Komagataeibacter diospyri]
MNISTCFGFFYKGCRVECTRKEARIILDGKVVGISKGATRSAIEQDIERVIAGEELA